MAEFNFIFSHEDHEILVDFLLGSGAEIIPDVFYDSAEYKAISNADTLQQLDNELKMTGESFIIWSKHYKFPLVFREIEKQFVDGKKKKFYIMPRHGGPYIGYLYHGQRKRDHANSTLLIPSTISHYPRFWVDESRSEFSCSIEIKEQYKLILKFIKMNSKKFSLKNRKGNYWIGEHALELLCSGNAHLNIDLDTNGLRNDI